MLCLLFVRRRKKKREREMAGGFFSQCWRLEARHALMAVQGRIFTAVRCN
jgi:hypothetical protein